MNTNLFICDATRQCVKSWLAMHNGNAESLARWMTRLPGRPFGMKTARALIAAVLA